ncbi:hypothetical protein OS493_033233 [Desmophyllum pertusum]|uniref:Uncharacterized protein n=1 Tax=Desmophyllum pertusum TaxID=174260 RepID=A0A9W9ZWF9_9CNID|nr:hypothetical protein OS493_033233 [Desmophyllum pertusum]
MMAQIQEHAANPHGAANKKTEKASVEKAIQAGGSSDSNETIDDLLAELNASNSFDEEDTGDNPTTHAAVETNLQRQQPSPQPSRRRSLPSTPPPPGHHDHRVFESLKSSVEKDFDHVHALMESLTAELNKSKNEVENCQEIIKSEQILRESIEDQLQHHLSQHREYKKKMTEEMAQLYARVRESEENVHKIKSENEELHQKNIMLTKENEVILKRVEDIEKETNVIQDKLFNGELVTRGENQTTDRKLQSSRQQQRPMEDVNSQPLGQHEQSRKFFEKLSLSETRSSLVIQILEALIEED